MNGYVKININPYESTASTSLLQPRRRAVRRYVVVFGLAVSVGAIAAIPAAVLLNQEWQLIPTNIYSSKFEINGRPISNAAVITYSCAIGGLLMLVGLLSAAFGFRNWRANKKI